MRAHVRHAVRRHRSELAPAPEMKQAAKAAHLRYVSDRHPGIRRVRTPRGFRYLAPDGPHITDEETISRIQKLAIPPAYQQVWICPDPNGHLQAVGRDARGRKQYRYHKRWREVRDDSKYAKMLLFGRVLPRIRERVEQDLTLRGLPRERVLAAMVRLLETTLMRVGNEEYAKSNRSYGLTTLRNRHVKVTGGHIHFDFRGKHGREHQIDVNDRRLARIVQRLQDLPGQDLFYYLDEEGAPHPISSEDVNEYLREITGEDITAKDFRTWAATNLAAIALRELESYNTQAKGTARWLFSICPIAAWITTRPARVNGATCSVGSCGAMGSGRCGSGTPPCSSCAGRKVHSLDPHVGSIQANDAARGRGDFDPSEQVEGHAKETGKQRLDDVSVADDRDFPFRPGVAQAQDRRDSAGLGGQHRLAARYLRGAAQLIEKLPFVGGKKFVEAAARPIAEVDLIQVGFDRYGEVQTAGERRCCLPCSLHRAGYERNNWPCRQRIGQPRGFQASGLVQRMSGGSSGQDMPQKIVRGVPDQMEHRSGGHDLTYPL